jgi:RNA ligase partner protein
MERFILDTSVFTNPDVFRQYAEGAEEAIAAFLDQAHRSEAEFFMPGSVYTELRGIKNIEALVADFESVVKIRSPRRYSLTIPAEFLYELIEEVRQRMDRGLRLAEEATRQAIGSTDPAHLITRLRERYRETLRRGILDSKEDVDCLLLAYELDGVLVSGDGGLRKWADKVGVKIIEPRHLYKVLQRFDKAKTANPPSPVVPTPAEPEPGDA